MKKARNVRRALVLAAGLVFATRPGAALTLHRSFTPTVLGTGGGTGVIVPAFSNHRTSGFVTAPEPNAPAKTKTFVGTVTAVADGDTIWVTPKGGARTKVQLFRINAPELDKPFGEAARKFLADLVLNRKVEVQYTRRSAKGEIGGIVFVKNEKGMVDANLSLILNGLARHDEADKTEIYLTSERQARAAKRGIWSL